MADKEHLEENGEGSPKIDIQLFDSPKQSFAKHRSFADRFKINQVDLKNKFKEYIIHQRMKYPLTNKLLKQSLLEESDEEGSLVSLRQIRGEKNRLITEMQNKLNQTNYLEKKKKDKERTFYLLKHKCERVEIVRQERKNDLNKIQKSMKAISEEIQKQKRKYRRSIEESRYNLTRSRIACQEKKNIQGKETRQQKELFAKLLMMQKEEEQARKKSCCEVVRQTQKCVHLTLSRFKEGKKHQADEVKLERLMREMADKEEVKIASSRVKEFSDRKKPVMIHVSTALENKIKKFRKSLAERRLTPQRRGFLAHKRNNSFAEQNDQSSTNGGNLEHSHYRRSYTEEAADG